MSTSAVTSNVFLDTEVFKTHQLDFSAPNFERFLRLVAAAVVRSLSTTVTDSEVKKHVDEAGKKFVNQVKNYKRASRHVRKVLPKEALEAMETIDEEAAIRESHDEYQKFLRESKTEILSVDGVSPERIMAQYFEQKAPFGEGDKKSEFPDAFAAQALQDWCASKSERLYVVSGDPDWKRACKDRPEFIHLSKLEGLLELFTDPKVVEIVKAGLEEEMDELKQLIDAKARDLDFYLTDSLVEGEIDDVERAEVEIEELLVVEAKAGQAVVNVFCTLNIHVFVSAYDPDSGVYDSEDKDMLYMRTMSGTVSRELERSVVVTVKYDPKDPENMSFEGVEFEDKEVQIDVEEGELTVDYGGYDDSVDWSEEPPDGEPADESEDSGP